MLREKTRPITSIHFPPWLNLDETTGQIVVNPLCDEFDISDHDFKCDNFYMYEFKVRRCGLNRAHDWTECPFAHSGEKARRRDPQKFHYSGDPCPDFRGGICKKGNACEYAHGVFECWLHPARYRTQWCKDGTSCCRSVCFFAHTYEQLRLTAESPYLLSPHSSKSPKVQGCSLLFSPTSTLTSPTLSTSSTTSLVDDMLLTIRNLQLNIKVGYSMDRPDFNKFPETQVRDPIGYVDFRQEEPVMERVESGKYLRAEIYEKLSKQNSLGVS
ncbi:Zinc finger ccch domain-containing protein [Thalictrum thalictroides]|uniref:Zinc finger ccch domain-containing protein n=1 Tax=Thalictrum thalictroides TaxID=46969 RepID=A0A7J6VEC6_THATH|nr:Zinc finger ccch domain-containing protein [Thalictrum thalictroides]